jgi:hypothetical protein
MNGKTLMELGYMMLDCRTFWRVLVSFADQGNGTEYL